MHLVNEADEDELLACVDSRVENEEDLAAFLRAIFLGMLLAHMLMV